MPQVSLTKAADFGELPDDFSLDGEHVRNPDGSLRLTCDLSDIDLSTHAPFLTGPIGGLVAVPDGTTYDVGPAAIAVRHEHVEDLKVAIHREHHKAARFLTTPLPPDPAPAS